MKAQIRYLVLARSISKMIVLRVSQFNVVKKCKMEWYAANVKVQQRDKQQCATSHGMQGHSLMGVFQTH